MIFTVYWVFTSVELLAGSGLTEQLGHRRYSTRNPYYTRNPFDDDVGFFVCCWAELFFFVGSFGIRDHPICSPTTAQFPAPLAGKSDGFTGFTVCCLRVVEETQLGQLNLFNNHIIVIIIISTQWFI